MLIGSNGQVGTEITRLWSMWPALANISLTGLTHADIEITDQQALASKLDETRADLIINTAGFLRVDECESSPERACLVNGVAVKYLADYAATRGCKVVQFSTDYVFDGAKGAPYTEADAPSPINVYGFSKLLGEHVLRRGLPDDHLIVRTAGVFGIAGSRNKGGNFIETMLRLADAGREIAVVDDQRFSPAYAPDLAGAVLTLIEVEARGTIHVTNSGVTTWHELAKAAFVESRLEPKMRAVTSEEYGAAASRPCYSALDNSRLTTFGIPRLRPWREALNAYLSEREAKA